MVYVSWNTKQFRTGRSKSMAPVGVVLHVLFFVTRGSEMKRRVTRGILLLLCWGAFVGFVFAQGRTLLIEQKNKEFSEKEITIKVGETVTFKNSDTVSHNVFSNSSCCKFNLKTQAPGESHKVKFENEGTVEVRCAIHPTMKLIIHVKK
jgi:plastocyanin